MNPQDRCKQRNKGRSEKVTEGKKKRLFLKTGPQGPRTHRATSRGDPKCEIACVQEEREHRLDSLGVVVYEAEVAEGQQGKVKGTG